MGKKKNKKIRFFITPKGIMSASELYAGRDSQEKGDGYLNIEGFKKFLEELEPSLYKRFREHPHKP